MGDHAYNASFDLYHATGVRVRFSVAADEHDDHRRRLTSYVTDVLGHGYSVTPPGLEPGEESETVNAWVMGETSKDERCVYLYAANAALQFRVATVYLERMGEMPFVIPAKINTWPGAAPTREMAENKKYLNAVPEFRIVMKPTGKMTDSGKVITKFDRVVGGLEAAPTAQPPNPAQPPKTAAPPPAVGSCTECHAPASKPHATGCPNAAPTINSLDEVEALDPNPTAASEEWAAIPGVQAGVTATEHEKAVGTKKVTPVMLKRLHAVGTEAYGDDWDAKRHELVDKVSAGAANSSSDLTPNEALMLISGMEKKIAAAAKTAAVPA